MSIYKTAAMSLLTGILGSGKTLRAVQLMDEAINDGEKVYQSGFKGVSIPGIIDWDDPREWQQLPPGAILFVDEAQKWFGERRAGSAPDYLKSMNTMRGEEGVRMVLLTQHPKYLDSHVKDLVGCHEHLLRESGKASSKLWRSDEIMEDPRSPRSRSKADTETFNFPIAKYGDKYVSANSDHTIKYRMPSLVKKAILVGGGGALALGIVWFSLFRNAYSELKGVKGEESGASGSATPTLTAGFKPDPAATGVAGGQRYTTTDAYIEAHTPRMIDRPWTAPIFDGRPVVTEPALFCMSSGRGKGADGRTFEAGCRCVTEQGTPYEMPRAMCEQLALNGQPYNPYRKPSEPPQQQQAAKTEEKADKVEKGGDRSLVVQAPDHLPSTGTFAAKL